jgi:hypothetical protein
MNVKEFKPKIHLMKFKVFDLKPLKVNSNVLDMSEFYKGLSKGLI